MTRDEATTFTNLNGLWEFQLADGFSDPIPFGKTLNQTILVPFPLEACLSGAFQWPTYSKYMFYRVLFNTPSTSTPGMNTLLHFGAVDWNSTYYLNGQLIGNHIGGYDSIQFDITNYLVPTNNELIVFVYDPSDTGYQPHGKQRISAIPSPGGDTYTPSSGIWQTAWLETVPNYHITNLRLRGDLTNLYITVFTSPNVPGTVNGVVTFQGNPVTTFTGDTFTDLVIPIPNPQLWNIGVPNLYDVNITVTEPSTGNTDSVGSYFGMRTVSLIDYQVPPVPATGARIGWDNAGGDMPGSPFNLNASDYNLCWAACNNTAGCMGWSYGVPSCGGDGATPQCWLKSSPGGWSQNQCRIAGDQGIPGTTAKRPAVNGKFTFLAGWLDQSWWPDGEYTAPTDDALAFDITSIPLFGLNAVRLHQKVNPQRWYYFADTNGIAVLQDGVQKYGGASEATIEPFLADFKAMMDGLYNHPSIIQWDVFNEGDCVGVFPNVTAVIDWVLQYDPSRLVDTNSGGPANGLYIADVNDDHSYPWPGHPNPSTTQYALDGEFGGIGAFIPGMEWANNECSTYLKADTPQIEADIYVNMTKVLISYKGQLSGSIYTQITDVENECDGFYTMNRTNKFTSAQLAEIVAANTALINA